MELGQTKIIAIDGYGGTGKSTAAKIIAEHFGGVVIYGDAIAFSFMENNPQISQSVFGYPMNGMNGREYFFEYLKTPEQYVELHAQIRQNFNEKVSALIKEYVAKQTTAVVFECSSSSRMYPWIGEKATKKILITADIEKLCQAFLAREKGNSLNEIPRIIQQGLTKLILPETADFIVYNDLESMTDYHNTLLSLCESWEDDDKSFVSPSRKAFAGLVK